MPILVPSPPALEALFRRTPVVDLDELRRTLGRASRTTVFRALRPLGYLTSYSHTGRYYTLRRIPRFDAHGLWWYHEIGFSVHGTLRRTLTHLIHSSAAGQTHEELYRLVHLRAYDTLRRLVGAQAVVRRAWQDASVYLSASPEVASTQWARRQALVPPVALALDSAQVVDVLVDVIHHPHDEAAAVARRLRAAGHPVPTEQVEAVFSRYDLKKTARTPSRRSRP
jgi:hypothetical protein